MPYLYTDEQNQIREETRRLLTARASADTLRGLLEQPGAYDQGYWEAAQEMGLPGMAVAEEHGGLGLGLIETLIVAEECGRQVVGAPFLALGHAAAHLLAQTPQDIAGEALAGIAEGRVKAALAFYERGEPLPATPSVTLTGGKLTGLKPAVTGGAAADVAIVLATGDAGPALALVDLSAAGVEREALESIDNSRGLANLRFNGAAALVLPANDALAAADETLQRLALLLASEGVGGADRCMEMARDYANERQAFGQPIGKFQAVKHTIAEMYVLNEMARASVLDAAVRIGAGDPQAPAYVAAARLNAIQAYETAAAASTQIHGGIGVTWEANLHLHYRRSRALAVEAGANFFWEDRIASVLGAA